MKLDKFIPKQKTLPYLGALWEIAGGVAFILSTLNMFFVTIIMFSTSEKVRNIFHSYTIFFLCYLLFGFVATYFVYVYGFPSRNKFNQNQAVINGGNPTFDKICVTEGKVDKIDEKVNGLEVYIHEIKEEIQKVRDNKV
jgi:hypothetical protein